MATPPRKPGEIRRSSDIDVERVASRPVERRAHRRQGGLFDQEAPTFTAPCVPTLVRTPPSGSDWPHEIKHDGYRVCCVLDRGKVGIFTRHGLDWADRMPGVSAALAALK